MTLRRPNLYIQIRSGIGNQLFQFSFGFALAKKYNYNLVLCPAYYDLGIKYYLKKWAKKEVRQFVLPLLVQDKFDVESGINAILGRQQVEIIHETDYDATVMQAHALQGRDMYLVGYWQHASLFSEYATELRTLIKPNIRFSSAYAQLTNSLSDNFVALHIRRGDFLTNKAFGACSLEYYLDAIELVKEKIASPVFYIFTNDKDWVRQNFPATLQYNFYSSAISQHPDIEEFYLMSLFKSLIISNSTFSWWSAYINTQQTKLVISPTNWFLEDTLQEDVHKLIQPEWICIENTLESLTKRV